MRSAITVLAAAVALIALIAVARAGVRTDPAAAPIADASPTMLPPTSSPPPPPPDRVDAFAAHWRDGEPGDRAAEVARAFAAPAGAAGRANWLALLGDHRVDELVRHEVALGLIRAEVDDELVAAFERSLADPGATPCWRQYCVQYLSLCARGERARPIAQRLLALADDADGGVAAAALLGLDRLDPASAAFPADLVERLLATAQAAGTSDLVRATALEVAARRAPVAALAAARGLAGSDRPVVRRAVAAVVARLAAGDDDRRLLAALAADRDPIVARAARSAPVSGGSASR